MKKAQQWRNIPTGPAILVAAGILIVCVVLVCLVRNRTPGNSAPEPSSRTEPDTPSHGLPAAGQPPASLTHPAQANSTSAPADLAPASSATVAAPAPASAPAVAARQPRAPAESDADPADAIAFAVDASVPVSQRNERILELARKADEPSIRTLIALADANVYMSSSAVRALGRVRAPEVTRYLAGKLAPDTNVRVVCAAVQSLAELEGEKAVNTLADCLEENHRRPDGLEELVWKECATVLGALNSPAALPVLKRELEWVGAAAQHLEYGIQLVEAVANLDYADGAPILDRYAADLESKIPADPRPKAYFEARIKETRAAADNLRRNTEPAS